MNRHLFGAGDPGAAEARKQRQADARVRITRRDERQAPAEEPAGEQGR